ncbi:hypothetical protein ACJX0J_017521, partial [Zea mays]
RIFDKPKILISKLYIKKVNILFSLIIFNKFIWFDHKSLLVVLPNYNNLLGMGASSTSQK